MSEQLPYAPPPSSGKTQLTTAAIILIVCASLGWLYSIIDAPVRIYNLSHGIAPPPNNAPGYSFGFYGAMYGTTACDILTFLLAPVLIFGAVQMLRTRMYGFCRTCAILAMLPIASNCCCIVTLPIGIWLIVVLNRPDVKDLFIQPGSP